MSEVDGSVDVTYATNGTLRSDCLTSATAPTPRSVVVAEDGRTLVSTWAGSPGVLVASADGTAMTTFAALGTAASSRSPLVAVDGGGYAIGECDAAPDGRLYRLDVNGSANVMFSPWYRLLPQKFLAATRIICWRPSAVMVSLALLT